MILKRVGSHRFSDVFIAHPTTMESCDTFLYEKHIQYVLDCLKDNPPRIRNIKQYLLAALYNAPLTIENYYAAQIDHDLCGGKR